MEPLKLFRYENSPCQPWAMRDMSAARGNVQATGRELVNVDWLHLIWQGRWDALVMIWHAIITDSLTFWWFGPLMLLMIIAIGRKGLLRLASQIARVWIHTHDPS